MADVLDLALLDVGDLRPEKRGYLHEQRKGRGAKDGQRCGNVGLLPRSGLSTHAAMAGSSTPKTSGIGVRNGLESVSPAPSAMRQPGSVTTIPTSGSI